MGSSTDESLRQHHPVELSDTSLPRSHSGERNDSETQRLLSGDEAENHEHWNSFAPDREERVNRTDARTFFIRALALLCACSLSVGSHYASYILGPIKSRLTRELGADNTEFSLLISAFSLNSTWTPLVAGWLAGRLGTTYTSILATGIIFLGQVLLLIGEVHENLRLMTFGLFVFGLGVSPLAVVQETIIVRFFKSSGLGLSMAIGLVAGKGASFVSARTSLPLSERFGSHAPFYVATSLAALSVVINLVYISMSKWLIKGTGTQLEAAEMESEARNGSHSMSEAEALEKVAAKRRVNLRDITSLDNVFWAYIALNVLCGSIWAPFTHLAANIIEKRYQLPELEASAQASYLLAGSIVLYPVCGYVVDRFKKRPIVLQLFLLSSALQMLCYFWLSLPPSWTHTPLPGIISFGAGIGFSPLLLVVIVPQLVPIKYVSTTLGAHKSLEQTGSVLMQTFAGLALDTKFSKDKNQSTPSRSGTTAIQWLLVAWLILNIAHFCGLLVLAHLDQKRKAAIAQATVLPETTEEVEEPLDPSAHEQGGVHGDNVEFAEGSIRLPHTPSPDEILGPDSDAPHSHSTSGLQKTKQVKRGEFFAGLCAVFIVFAWALFLVTAWLRLRSKKDRQNSN